MSWNKDAGAIVLSIDAAKMAMGWHESMTRINKQILGNSILKSRQKRRERQNWSDLRQRETEESRFIEREGFLFFIKDLFIYLTDRDHK